MAEAVIIITQRKQKFPFVLFDSISDGSEFQETICRIAALT